MTNEKKLQAALKRKVVLRETLHHTSGYKAKSVDVTRIDSNWYGFNIDGNYFECRWHSVPGWKENKATLYFRNNTQLEKAGLCDPLGVSADRVKYASSLHFGYGGDIIKCLWLVGEVLEKKDSYNFSKGWSE